MRRVVLQMVMVFGLSMPVGRVWCGPYAPAAGQTGSTAISKDSSSFVAWATGATVVRGYQQINNPSLGYASYGTASNATGKADCSGLSNSGVVSLGDGGTAVLTFAKPITDTTGYDFAVFENSFSDAFLELAFVEVSSDGVNYFRFPSVSLTDATIQIGSYEQVQDATNLNNLAGKYRGGYGTPFDLAELRGVSGLLNVDRVTHVRIVDVVGCIEQWDFNGDDKVNLADFAVLAGAYGSHVGWADWNAKCDLNRDWVVDISDFSVFASQWSSLLYKKRDSQNHVINDPWPTFLEPSGFDLDAVGVIHQASQ